MNLPSPPQTEAGERTASFFKRKKKERNECLSLLPFVRCRRRKKNGECSFLLSFYHETERKNAFPLSFPRRKKKRQYALLPLFWRTDKKKKKGEPHLSFFILSLPQMEWRISPSLKKEKDEKMEERRQKEEGQKRKGTERRKKEKEARERRPEKRQQSMSQKGAFLTQESRKGAGRGFPVRKQETGLRTPFFAS